MDTVLVTLKTVLGPLYHKVQGGMAPAFSHNSIRIDNGEGDSWTCDCGKDGDMPVPELLQDLFVFLSSLPSRELSS